MPKILEDWQVQPHGPLEKVADGILTVTGEIVMPLGRFPRRMTAVRLSGGRTAIFSAIALEEPLMERIEALGRPAFLIVPNGGHRLDARIWHKRYPAMRIMTPFGAREPVMDAVPIDATGDIMEDPQVRFVTVAGTKAREAAMIVARGGETSLIVNDLIARVAHPHGMGAKLMAWLFGFGTKRPQMPWPVRRKIVADRNALAGELRLWAELPGLARIIPSHGEIMADDPAGILRDLASRLARGDG